jgi:predicted MFS family arabinose efflux permease
MDIGVSGVVGVIARVAWAVLSERSGQPSTWMAVLSGGGVACLMALSAAQWLGPVWIWIGAVGMGLTAGAWNVVAQLTVIRENGTEEAARATGLLQSSFLLGLGAGAPTFGLLIERTGSFQLGWLLMAAAALMATAVAIRELRARRNMPADPAGAVGS